MIHLKSTLVIYLLFILCSSSAFAQADYVRGYILLTKTDTISGLVDNNGDATNSLVCRFKRSENDQVEKYTPNKVFGYKLNNGKYYISKSIGSEKLTDTIFVECLVEGEVSLYFSRNVNGNHYYLEKQGLSIRKISIADETIYRDGVPAKYKYLINRGLIRFYLQECPELFNDIDEIRVPNHTNLMKLVKKYDDIICPEKACVLYIKKKPEFRMDVQPIIGLVNYLDLGFVSQYGILTYTWLPMSNEKLFFRCGFLYSKYISVATGVINESGLYSNENVEDRFIKIPLQFQYVFLKKRISPTMGGGMNIITGNELFGFTIFPALNVGLNATINKNLYVSLYSECDFWAIPTHTQFVSYSFNLGLTMKL